MSFLTIHIETPDGPAKLNPNREHSLRKAVAAFLELEIGRNFESVSVVQHDDPPSLAFHVRGPRDEAKLSVTEREFLDNLNAMLSDSAYQVNVTGGIYRADTQVELVGCGIDWRKAMDAVKQKGVGLLPGLVASILSGAEEYEEHEAKKHG